MTTCLDEPVGVYPDEPARPKVLTDEYVKALIGWTNRILGIATDDRLRWRGERRCIRALEGAGQIR